MTRGLLIIIAVVAAGAAAGYGACRAAGIDPHPGGLGAAAAVSLVAAALALLPLAFVRGAAQPAVAQAALAGSMIHLVGHVLAAGAVVLGAPALRAPPGFTAWLMAFYALTLLGLVVGLARAVRAAAPHGDTPSRPAAGANEPQPASPQS